MELPTLWQDWVLFIGQLLFFIALIPSIASPHKPSVWTSLITAGVLTSFAIVFWSLSLLLGAVTAGLVAAGWYVLFFQKALSRRG